MALLEVKGISLSKNGRKILDNVSLSVERGVIHSIIGPNGAGKSSLAYVIMGLPEYRPERGRVFFDGKDITDLPIWERARMGLALAWQEPARFEGITVEAFISLGMREKDAKKVRKALEEVLLDPDQYLNRMVDQTLSGGERKRIELASLLVMDPKLIILDEPDSGMDIVAINAIVDLVKRLRDQGVTILLITHSEEVVKIADRATLICNGKVVIEGDVSDVGDYFRAKCVPCPTKRYEGVG